NKEAKTTIAGILTEIDVRGEGGYVKLPPSIFNDGSGRYTVSADEYVADCPQWLIDLLNKRGEPISNLQIENRESWLEDILDGVGEGERHQALVRLAGYYYNCMNADVAAQHLREWNKKNRPPYKDKELEEQIIDFSQRFTKGEYSSQYIE